MNGKKFEPLHIRAETMAQIEWLAGQLGKKKAPFVAELIDAVFDIATEYKELRGIMYDSKQGLAGPQLLVTFWGKLSAVAGAMAVSTDESDESVDKKVRERVEEDFEERDKDE